MNRQDTNSFKTTNAQRTLEAKRSLASPDPHSSPGVAQDGTRLPACSIHGVFQLTTYLAFFCRPIARNLDLSDTQTRHTCHIPVPTTGLSPGVPE